MDRGVAHSLGEEPMEDATGVLSGSGGVVGGMLASTSSDNTSGGGRART